MSLSLESAISQLDAWLQSVRQPGGYAGPVAHWWQNRYRYTGPGLDWRYEGILSGYSLLYKRTKDERWRQQLEDAAEDLIHGQDERGHYQASSFEANPGTLGTPHEAAATLGLLNALPHLPTPVAALALKTAGRNIAALIKALWDEDAKGFNDVPGMSGRVPNKLATFAQTLMRYAELSGEEQWLFYAQAALEDVLKLQEASGRYRGAVHQYAPDNRGGDGRFFIYYNARCIPPLAKAAQVFDARYREAAYGILDFIARTMTPEGAWPQLLYASGKQAEWPRWIAGAGDILLGFHSVGEAIPAIALERLLAGQLASGGFRSAEGFSSQPHQRSPQGPADYRDITPVAGWNDKAFRLLCELLPAGASLPAGFCHEVVEEVTIWGCRAVFCENGNDLIFCTASGKLLYHWHKGEPWARVVTDDINMR